MPEHIHFVTGRLAEFALRQVLEQLRPTVDFDFSVGVLGITVAALMTPEWIARKVHVPAAATQVLVPGYCHGDLAPIAAATGLPVDRGPKDLRELSAYFGKRPPGIEQLGPYDIEILAEINQIGRAS